MENFVIDTTNKRGCHIGFTCLAGFHVHACRSSIQAIMPVQYGAVTQSKERLLAMCNAMADKKKYFLCIIEKP